MVCFNRKKLPPKVPLKKDPPQYLSINEKKDANPGVKCAIHPCKEYRQTMVKGGEIDWGACYKSTYLRHPDRKRRNCPYQILILAKNQSSKRDGKMGGFYGWYRREKKEGKDGSYF